MSIELSPDEESRQLRTLTKLRNRQHRLLIDSGIARRMLDADVPINWLKDSSEFTEGTLLYPIRRQLSETAIGRLYGIKDTIAGSCEQLPQDHKGWSDFFSQYPLVDAVLLGRLEALPNGFNRSNIHAGIQLERSNPDAGVIPMDGILHTDIMGIVGMLGEVEELRETEELSCLDPDILINVALSRNGPIPLP